MPSSSDEKASRLSRAVVGANLLVDAKGDFVAAAKMLDTALQHDDQDATHIQRTQALILRAVVAANMDDHALAKSLLSDVNKLSWTADEKIALADDLQKASELAQTFS